MIPVEFLNLTFDLVVDIKLVSNVKFIPLVGRNFAVPLTVSLSFVSSLDGMEKAVAIADRTSAIALHAMIAANALFLMSFLAVAIYSAV
jgi:hypothetical protein